MKFLTRYFLVLFFLMFSLSAIRAEKLQYKIEVWADNWFAAYINGKPLLQDSESITTERSFNAEVHQFSAISAFTLAFIIMDFKQNDTGLEYIGSHRQQMGDGGFITQITNLQTNNVVAVSNKSMRCKVIHKAPLDANCVNQTRPIAGQGDCQFIAKPEPYGWQSPNYDDIGWQNASEYSVAQVRPKDGYYQIKWHSSARLIWTSDLEKHNTLLCRLRVNSKNQTSQAATYHSHDGIHSHFSHFNNVKTNQDSTYLLIESNGIPEHNMMEGITSWQQQVPLPQDYTGNNSWKVPLKPTLAHKPLLTKNHFHRGAIAIAINGVPIFNALNNRGEYSADIGELDKWGGHSGRADDYHYHLAPVHLEKIVGKGNPIAYALDGFPLYGKTKKPLDQYLGRFNQAGSYQYHAVDYPPYLIAGLRGVVQTDSPANAPEDQIEPQPRSIPVRNRYYRQLKGAAITNFTKINNNSYSLDYLLNNQKHQINYSWNNHGEYKFVFIDQNGRQTVETYQKNNQQRAGNRRSQSIRNQPASSSNRQPPPRNQQQRRYCGDGLCDNTESKSQCPADC